MSTLNAGKLSVTAVGWKDLELKIEAIFQDSKTKLSNKDNVQLLSAIKNIILKGVISNASKDTKSREIIRLIDKNVDAIVKHHVEKNSATTISSITLTAALIKSISTAIVKSLTDALKSETSDLYKALAAFNLKNGSSTSSATSSSTELKAELDEIKAFCKDLVDSKEEEKAEAKKKKEEAERKAAKEALKKSVLGVLNTTMSRYNRISSAINTILKKLTKVIGSLAKLGKWLFAKFTLLVTDIGKTIFKAVSSVYNRLKSFVSGVFRGIWNGIRHPIQTITNFIKSFPKLVLKTLVNVFKLPFLLLWKTVKGIYKSVAWIFKTTAKITWWMTKIVLKSLVFIVKGLADIALSLAAFTVKIGLLIALTALIITINAAISFLTSGIGLLILLVTGALLWAKNGFDEMMDTIHLLNGDASGNNGEHKPGFISTIGNTIVGWLSSMLKWAFGSVKGFFEWIGTKFVEVITGVSRTAGQLTKPFKDWLIDDVIKENIFHMKKDEKLSMRKIYLMIEDKVSGWVEKLIGADKDSIYQQWKSANAGKNYFDYLLEEIIWPKIFLMSLTDWLKKLGLDETVAKGVSLYDKIILGVKDFLGFKNGETIEIFSKRKFNELIAFIEDSPLALKVFLIYDDFKRDLDIVVKGYSEYIILKLLKAIPGVSIAYREYDENMILDLMHRHIDSFRADLSIKVYDLLKTSLLGGEFSYLLQGKNGFFKNAVEDEFDIRQKTNGWNNTQRSLEQEKYFKEIFELWNKASKMGVDIDAAIKNAMAQSDPLIGIRELNNAIQLLDTIYLLANKALGTFEISPSNEYKFAATRMKTIKATVVLLRNNLYSKIAELETLKLKDLQELLNVAQKAESTRLKQWDSIHEDNAKYKVSEERIQETNKQEHLDMLKYSETITALLIKIKEQNDVILASLKKIQKLKLD